MLHKPFGNVFWARGLSRIYTAAVHSRNRLYNAGILHAERLQAHTISIGGIHAGGTGKTPLTIMIARLLMRHGWEVAILSRGYRRTNTRTVLASPDDSVDWETVGDEPAMMKQEAPGVWLGIDSQRVRAGRLALERIRAGKPDQKVALALDDGFQHRRLHRDLDIVCLPLRPLEHALIPAGCLREPLESLRRAHMLCVIAGYGESGLLHEAKSQIQKIVGKPIILLYQRPGEWISLRTGRRRTSPPAGKCGLLAGIARPERFERMVRKMNIDPAATAFYPDHHVFSQNDLEPLLKAGCDTILTTPKDIQRIRAIKFVNCPNIWYLTLRLSFLDERNETLFSEKILRGDNPS